MKVLAYLFNCLLVAAILMNCTEKSRSKGSGDSIEVARKKIIESGEGSIPNGILNPTEKIHLSVDLTAPEQTGNMTGFLRTSSPFVGLIDTVAFFEGFAPGDTTRTNVPFRFEMLAKDQITDSVNFEYPDSIQFEIHLVKQLGEGEGSQPRGERPDETEIVILHLQASSALNMNIAEAEFTVCGTTLLIFLTLENTAVLTGDLLAKLHVDNIGTNAATPEIVPGLPDGSTTPSRREYMFGLSVPTVGNPLNTVALTGCLWIESAKWSSHRLDFNLPVPCVNVCIEYFEQRWLTPGVNVELIRPDGTVQVAATTGLHGKVGFAASDLAAQTYTLRLSGPAFSGTNGISPTDVNLCNAITTPTAEQIMLGDVNGNSSLDSDDCTKINNFRTGGPSGSTGDWQFINPGITVSGACAAKLFFCIKAFRKGDLLPSWKPLVAAPQSPYKIPAVSNFGIEACPSPSTITSISLEN